jgi:DNA-binding GntR family transcriptional regulator
MGERTIMPPSLHVASAPRLRDQVYDRLRDDLESGALPADHRFVELELAERYGVSRTPVREALLQLAREGILLPLERGYTLQTVSLKQILDRLEVRRMLDADIARRAALAMSPRELRKAQEAVARARSAHEKADHRLFADAQKAFRTTLREACGNETLARCSAMVDDSFRFLRMRLYESPAHRESTLVGIEAILEAVDSGSADAAETATLRFLDALADFHAKSGGS